MYMADAQLARILDARETDGGVTLGIGFTALGCSGDAGVIAAPVEPLHRGVIQPSDPRLESPC